VPDALCHGCHCDTERERNPDDVRLGAPETGPDADEGEEEGSNHFGHDALDQKDLVADNLVDADVRQAVGDAHGECRGGWAGKRIGTESEKDTQVSAKSILMCDYLVYSLYIHKFSHERRVIYGSIYVYISFLQ
jgi:hypothetical protein